MDFHDFFLLYTLICKKVPKIGARIIKDIVKRWPLFLVCPRLFQRVENRKLRWFRIFFFFFLILCVGVGGLFLNSVIINLSMLWLLYGFSRLFFLHTLICKKFDKDIIKLRKDVTLDFLEEIYFTFTGVFLICWLPFFTCNIMDAICTKLTADCQPGVTAFIVTSWLGYMNSFVNPVIYTVFNPEFRKAFHKLVSF